jgi:aspartyl-tRNA(Asn)/glutamyl-tRNA(Gln) amidotransferase subunit A
MFSFSSIRLYHDQLLKGETSCTDAVSHYLKKIEAESNLNAFVEVFAEEALAKASELDRNRAAENMKKLHGVVIAIKDVICYKDHKVTAASGVLKDFVSLYTASALQYLIDEDAIIIGTCNCDEFAMGSTSENSIYGSVLNAADQAYVPGGSSGGSAVAVQAGLCMVSLGSDTGGSVRQPADFCGIIGMKPGYGRISRYGLIAYASSFDQIGVFGKTLHDVAKVMDAMTCSDEFDSTMDSRKNNLSFESYDALPEKKFRFCFLKQMMQHESLDPEIKDSIYQVIDHLRSEGHVVEEIEFDLLEYIVPAYYILTTAEASSNLSRYDGIRYGPVTGNESDLTHFYSANRSHGFGKEVKRRIMLGIFVLSAGYYDAYFAKAQQVRRLLINHTNRIFGNFDIMLLPTSPCTAFKLNQHEKNPVAMYLADIYTVFANLTGIPGISLPLFKHSNGLPFGLQLMADKKDEVNLLHASKWFMQHARAPLPGN